MRESKNLCGMTDLSTMKNYNFFGFLFLIFLLLCLSSVFPCTTPNRESAFCISLFSCPPLMKSLGTMKPSAVGFVKSSICHDFVPGDLFVCCGTMGNYADLVVDTQDQNISQPCVTTTTTTNLVQNTTNTQDENSSQIPFTSATSSENPIQNEEKDENMTQIPIIPIITIPENSAEKPLSLDKLQHRDLVKKELLPSRKYCGLQHTDDRFYNDTATALDEFPWLAHVVAIVDEDDDPYQFLDRCNGVLISNRYVLSSGSCIFDALSVRLGQYYTNLTVACIENPDFPECTEQRLEVEVEEEIHRNNNSDQESSWHDFGLLRLAKGISYSDFIRPICLPFDVPRDFEEFAFSGWGGRENIAAVKKRISFKPTEIEECYKLDSHDLRAAANVTVVCMTPKGVNKDPACTGDDGGPLMYSHRHQWFVDSVVTELYYKPNPENDDDRCSFDSPITGVKITQEILEWILDNMRP